MKNIVNGIELYEISNPALEQWRKECKYGKEADRDVINRKLTAMILCDNKKKRISENKYCIRFGGFVMIINEQTRKIETIGWDKDDHKSYISKTIGEQLRKFYNQLGLSHRGNSYISV